MNSKGSEGHSGVCTKPTVLFCPVFSLWVGLVAGELVGKQAVVRPAQTVLLVFHAAQPLEHDDFATANCDISFLQPTDDPYRQFQSQFEFFLCPFGFRSNAITIFINVIFIQVMKTLFDLGIFD